MIQKSTHAVPRADLGVAFHEYSPTRARFIAGEILPSLPLGKEAATISVTKRKNLTIPSTKHANGAAYNRVTLYMDDMAYACVDHGLEAQVTDRDRAKYASDFDAEIEKTQAIKIKMLLAREKRVKALPGIVHDPRRGRRGQRRYQAGPDGPRAGPAQLRHPGKRHDNQRVVAD